MTKHALALALSLLATPLWALSCMAPDAVFLFQDIKKSDDRFYFVKGTVTLTEPANIPLASDTKNTEAFTMARVTGQAMTASGFNARFDQPVSIRATCLGPWCGSPEGLSEEPHFLAIKIDGDDLLIMKESDIMGVLS